MAQHATAKRHVRGCGVLVIAKGDAPAAKALRHGQRHGLLLANLPGHVGGDDAASLDIGNGLQLGARHPRSREAISQQHFGEIDAVLAAVGAEDHGREAAAIMGGGGNKVETGTADKTGLHAVRLLHLAEQRIAIGEVALADGEVGLREIMIIFRKLPQDRRGQDGDVARRGDMALIEETVGIDEMAPRHAEFAGLGVHLGGEGRDAAIGSFGQDIGHVIGRIDQQRLQREIDADPLAHRHADLAGRLGMGQFGDGQLLVRLEFAGTQLLEDDVGRHELGDGGGVPRLAGTVLGDHLLGGRVKQQGWAGREGGRRQRQQEQRQENASEDRQERSAPGQAGLAKPL